MHGGATHIVGVADPIIDMSGTSAKITGFLPPFYRFVRTIIAREQCE